MGSVVDGGVAFFGTKTVVRGSVVVGKSVVGGTNIVDGSDMVDRDLSVSGEAGSDGVSVDGGSNKIDVCGGVANSGGTDIPISPPAIRNSGINDNYIHHNKNYLKVFYTNPM